MSAVQPENFDDFVDDLRRRIGIADAVKPDVLHSFKDLLGDEYVIPAHWLREAFEELDTQEHLHKASRLAFGDAHGRLSADGRWYLRSLDEEAGAA
jgi:hypothetical protein